MFAKLDGNMFFFVLRVYLHQELENSGLSATNLSPITFGCQEDQVLGWVSERFSY